MKGRELNDTTAQKIRTAAREVFLARGYDGTTMQAVGEKTGFNKALIHYYFRSKDGLFFSVFQTEFQGLLNTYAPVILDESLPLVRRLEACIEAEVNRLSESPDLLLFFHAEMHRNPALIEKLIGHLKLPDLEAHLARLNAQLRDQGCSFTFEQILMTLRSILRYPVIDTQVSHFLLNIEPEKAGEFWAGQVQVAREVLARMLK